MAAVVRTLSEKRYLVAAAAGTLLLLGLAQWGELDSLLDFRIRGFLYRTAPALPRRHKIVIVAVTGSTLAKWPEPQVFWTGRFSRLLEHIAKSRPKWIGLDYVLAADTDRFFEENHIAAPEGETRLHDSLAGLKSQITLAALQGAGEGSSTIERLAGPARATDNEAWVDFLPEEYGCPVALPTLTSPGSEPGFAYAISARSCGLDPNSPGTLAALGVGAEGFRLNYRCRDFPVIDAATIESGTVSPSQANLLRDAVVLVGTNALTSDVHSAPTGQSLFGVDIQATGVSTVLEGAIPRAGRSPSPLAIGFASFAAFWRLSPLVGIAVAAATALCLYVLAGLLLAKNIELAIAAPMIAVLSAAICAYAGKSSLDRSRRNHVEQVFGANVSPGIRDVLLSDRENLQIRGRRCDGSVLFVDLRNSVGLAFERDPQEVMDDLNALFASIVPNVHRHGGLLSRFTGDGFLALFGIPVPRQDHADAAVLAATDIVASVKERNRSSERPLRVGCGINSGEVVGGNLGIHERNEFTVIGDVVNVAARIESLTKEAAFDILVGQGTVERMKDRRCVGTAIEARFRGRKESISLVYPICTEPEDLP